MKHERELKEYLQLVIQDNPISQNPARFWGSMIGTIPKDISPATSVKQEYTDLILSEEERDHFYKCFKILREDIQTEYLKDSELKDKLWRLTCEIFLDRNQYKNGSELKRVIQSFLTTLCQPLETYEVMFQVLNFVIESEVIKLWGCELHKFDEQELFDWGMDSTKHSSIVAQFKGQTVIILKENGNNTKQVLNRARKNAKLRLNALQTFISEREFLIDEEVLFGLSEIAVCKKISSKTIVLSSWQRGRKPIPLTYSQDLQNFILQGNELLTKSEKFTPKLKAIIERTVYWIGKSIDETDTDVKITALCTALETMLTSKSDKRKGEAIAYRMAILEALHEGKISHPSESLWIYELRSSVIHGSGLEITTRSEYFTMLRDTRDTLRNFIKYVDENKIAKQSDLIKTLETSTIAEKLQAWLEEFIDDRSVHIKNALLEARSIHITK